MLYLGPSFGVVLPFCRDAISVFSSPSQLEWFLSQSNNDSWQKNGPFTTIINYWFNGLFMMKHSNTFLNQNCMNRRLWWLSGSLPLALSITASRNLTRVSLWKFTHQQVDEICVHLSKVQPTLLNWRGMISPWQCSDTCYQEDTAEAHWLGIWNFAISTIFDWFLNHQL